MCLLNKKKDKKSESRSPDGICFLFFSLLDGDRLLLDFLIRKDTIRAFYSFR